MQSDSSRFSRRVDRDNTMVTEGHKYAGRKIPEMMSAAKRGKELADIRARMEELELRMQQNTKLRWVYEWPMRKLKVRWPFKELMARKKRRLLKVWLRHVENLDGPKEMVQICEQRLGEISVKRIKWDQLKVSRTARRAKRKFQIARWEMS
jgi:hypothetical protein